MENLSNNSPEGKDSSDVLNRVENVEFVDAQESSSSDLSDKWPTVGDTLPEVSVAGTIPCDSEGDREWTKLSDKLNQNLTLNSTPSKSENSDAYTKDEVNGEGFSLPKEDEDGSGDQLPSDAEDSDDEEAYHSAEEGDIVIDEENLKEIEANLTEEEKQARREEAQVLKEEGNKLFKEAQYSEAIKAYGKALTICPLAFPKDRSIMYSNRAACHMRSDNNEQAIEDSTKALKLNPNYLKALLRRAELYEKTEKLDEALVDYKKVVEMDPMQHTARAACLRLPDQIKERNEKLKEEMLGKLKDLGNMILKPFGLSTNNFQLQQDPNTGGYSVQFNNNGK